MNISYYYDRRQELKDKEEIEGLDLMESMELWAINKYIIEYQNS